MTALGRLEQVTGAMRFVAAAVVVALLAAAVFVMWPGDGKKYLSATFPRTVALYEGSDVKILGVPVGQVEAVNPSGTQVHVRMWYDSEEAKVPDDAQAVIVSPSVVGDRYVQLTPAYTGGPTLPDGAHLNVDRTAEPVELDRIYRSLNSLNVALGPRGANKNGALSRLLNVTAANFEGQGKQFHQTITDLGRFSATLDNNKEELFGSLRQLARFTATLRRNDQNIREFNANLARMSEFLEGERDDLAGAMNNLGRAMHDITGFVRSNRHLMRENINGLTQVSGVLVKQREALKKIMDVAPLALNNLALTYNPLTGTLDTRANVGENVAQLQHDPGLFLCTLTNQADDSGRTCDAIQRAFDSAAALPRPRTMPFGAESTNRWDRPVQVEHIDKTLAGILDGGDR
jgi:phospholipid/cholesterol/gamma-HCH transport system substrate-binding protein